MHAFDIALFDLMYSYCRTLFTSKFRASATRSSPTMFHQYSAFESCSSPGVCLNWILTEVYDGNGSFYAAHRDNEHHVHKGDGRPWVSWLNVFPSSEILQSPVEVGSLSHYLQGFQHHPRSLALGFLNHQPYVSCWIFHVFWIPRRLRQPPPNPEVNFRSLTAVMYMNPYGFDDNKAGIWIPK